MKNGAPERIEVEHFANGKVRVMKRLSPVMTTGLHGDYWKADYTLAPVVPEDLLARIKDRMDQWETTPVNYLYGNLDYQLLRAVRRALDPAYAALLSALEPRS